MLFCQLLNITFFNNLLRNITNWRSYAADAIFCVSFYLLRIFYQSKSLKYMRKFSANWQWRWHQLRSMYRYCFLLVFSSETPMCRKFQHSKNQMKCWITISKTKTKSSVHTIFKSWLNIWFITRKRFYPNERW